MVIILSVPDQVLPSSVSQWTIDIDSVNRELGVFVNRYVQGNSSPPCSKLYQCFLVNQLLLCIEFENDFHHHTLKITCTHVKWYTRDVANDKAILPVEQLCMEPGIFRAIPAFTFRTVHCFPNRGGLRISINVIATDTAAKCKRLNFVEWVRQHTYWLWHSYKVRAVLTIPRNYIEMKQEVHVVGAIPHESILGCFIL